MTFQSLKALIRIEPGEVKSTSKLVNLGDSPHTSCEDRLHCTHKNQGWCHYHLCAGNFNISQMRCHSTTQEALFMPKILLTIKNISEVLGRRQNLNPRA